LLALTSKMKFGLIPPPQKKSVSVFEFSTFLTIAQSCDNKGIKSLENYSNWYSPPQLLLKMFLIILSISIELMDRKSNNVNFTIENGKKYILVL